MTGDRELEPRLLGTLAIVVVRAKNLPDRSRLGKQDPYCVFKYNNETKRTKKVTKGGQHPEFDDEVRFSIYEDLEDVLDRKKTSDTPSLSSAPATPEKDRASLSSSSFIKASSSITNNPSKKGVIMQLFADDSKEPKTIGETVVDLQQVIKLGEHDDWYTLSHKDRYAGEVSLELTYFINSAPPMPPKVAKPLKRPSHGGPGGHLQPTSSQSLPQRRPLSTASLVNLRADGLPGSSSASSSLSYAGGRSQYQTQPVDNFDRATAMLLNGGNGGRSSGLEGSTEQGQAGLPRRVSYPNSSSPTSLHPVDPTAYPPFRAPSPAAAAPFRAHSPMPPAPYRAHSPAPPQPYRSHSPAAPPPRPVSSGYDPLTASFSNLTVGRTAPSHVVAPYPPFLQDYPSSASSQPRHSLSFTTANYPPEQHAQANPPPHTAPPAVQYGNTIPPGPPPSVPSSYTSYLPPSSSFPHLPSSSFSGYPQPQTQPLAALAPVVPQNQWQQPGPTTSYGPPQSPYPTDPAGQHLSPTPSSQSGAYPRPDGLANPHGMVPLIDNRPPLPSAAPPPLPPPRPISTGHYSSIPTSSFPQGTLAPSQIGFDGRPLPVPQGLPSSSQPFPSAQSYVQQQPPSRQDVPSYQYQPQTEIGYPAQPQVDHRYQNTTPQPGSGLPPPLEHYYPSPPPPPPPPPPVGPQLPSGAAHSRRGRAYLSSLGVGQSEQPNPTYGNQLPPSHAYSPPSQPLYTPYPDHQQYVAQHNSSAPSLYAQTVPPQSFPPPHFPQHQPPVASQYPAPPQPTSWYGADPFLPTSSHPGQH